MVSYGVAFLVIAIALYVVATSGVLHPSLAADECTPSPGFECVDSAAYTNGSVIIKLLQITGGTIKINADACSYSLNGTDGEIPKYGNINLVSNALYPVNAIPSTVYTDNSTILNIDCYGPSGIDKGRLGSTFRGYIFINYTIEEPGLINNHTDEMVAYLSTAYKWIYKDFAININKDTYEIFGVCHNNDFCIIYYV